MRIGIVCPYSWDIPGGVQAHVRDLAEQLIVLGHDVSVLAPGDDETAGLPPYVVMAGKAALRFPYNGSVAHLQFGLIAAARVRRWLRDGDFDVVHVHEPAPPSLSLLTCMIHDGPIVATFHSAVVRSRWLTASDVFLQPFLEKITGKIAVSPAARNVIVEHLGGDAVVIPNGVSVARFAAASPLPEHDAPPHRHPVVGFVGRYDEARKGMDVLLGALERLGPDFPDLRLLVVGHGDAEEFFENCPPALAERVELLGQVDDETKAAMLATLDVYCAPNVGGESFGVILLEAMAARVPVVASDLDAFRRVLDGGRAGRLFPVGDADALAAALAEVLASPALRAELVAAGERAVGPYDWSTIAAQVLRVYELAAQAGVPAPG